MCVDFVNVSSGVVLRENGIYGVVGSWVMLNEPDEDQSLAEVEHCPKLSAKSCS